MFKGTVIVEEIDGIDIIKGFGEPVIDPIETRKIVDQLLFETDEYKDIINKQLEMEAIKKIGSVALAASGIAERKHDHFEAEKQFTIYNQQSKAFDKAMEELKGLQPALKVIHKKLFNDNTVFCHPKGTEFIKDINEVAALRDKKLSLLPTQELTLDNEIVDNYRGKKYWKKTSGEWHIIEINVIGEIVQTGGKFISELSETERVEISEQLKKERIATLSPEEKEESKQAEITSAAASAAGMRSQLEIQDDPDPLGKSKAEYNKKLTEINEMYG